MSNDDPSRRGSFVIFRNWTGEYAWSLLDNEGAPLIQSSTRYPSLSACLEVIERVKRFAGTAGVREDDRGLS